MDTRIRPTGLPSASAPGFRIPEERRKSDKEDLRDYYSPKKPEEHYIPPDTIIQELVKRALSALQRGITWDRGSIVNIVI